MRPTVLDRAAPERQPSSSGWLLPVLLALVVAVAGAVVAIALSDDAERRSAPATATGGSLTLTGQETLTAPEPPAATASTAPRAARARRPPARPSVPRSIVWPADKRGWTIVLLSVPQENGRAAAVERAEEARRGGLRRVGILNSSRFASLHPGYYVVFHGVFDSEAEATSSLRRARGVVRLAYVRQITP